MELIKSVKDIFTKILSLGKPSDDDVLYSKVIKKEIPKESAEELTIMEIKETITHLFHDDDEKSDNVTEFSRGAPTPPVKEATAKKTVKKKPAAKKTTTKKTADTTKTTTEKKSSAKKNVDRTTC